MRPLTLLFLSVFTCLSAFSQNVAINNDGTTADGSAILDIKSTTKGVVFPRMTQAERLAITSPAKGLLVYQTDGTEGLYYNNGTAASPDWAQISKVGASGTPVAFAAAATSFYQALSAGVYTKIQFPTEQHDESNNFVPGATSQFTAPSTGIYHFDASTGINGNGFFYLAFFVNNVAQKLKFAFYGSTQDFQIDISANIKLTAGDVVDVRVLSSAGSNMYNVALPWTWFNGHKVN